ncbi:hypothetical protein H4R99_002356 [Coemansia sp. RSA 1722]|nr:hypothetical protein H4R99_002356 [Coemansia sp. RSA 1722]
MDRTQSASVSGQIIGLAQQITSLTQQMSGLTQQIAAQAQQKASSDQQIAGLLQQIAGQAQQISAMQSRITALEMQNVDIGGSDSLLTQKPSAQVTPNRSSENLFIDVAAAGRCTTGIETPLNTASVAEDSAISAQSTEAATAGASSSVSPEKKPDNRTSAVVASKDIGLADDEISLFPDDSIMDALKSEHNNDTKETTSVDDRRGNLTLRIKSHVNPRHSRSPSRSPRRRGRDSWYNSRHGRSRSISRSYNRDYGYGRGRSTSRERGNRNELAFSTPVGRERRSCSRDRERNTSHRRRKSHSRDYDRAYMEACNQRTPNARDDRDTKDSCKKRNSGWVVINGAAADNKSANVHQDPVMPASVKNLSGEKTSLSSYEKVCAWQQEVANDDETSREKDKWRSSKRLSINPIKTQKPRRPSQTQSDNSVFAIDTSRDNNLDRYAARKSESPAAVSGLHETDSSGFAGRSGNDQVSSDEDDEDDDDSINPLSMLRSKSFSAGPSLQLTDSSGVAVTSERLGMLWSLCAWVPLDSLDAYYEKMFRANLYYTNTKAQIKTFVKGQTNFAERRVKLGIAHQVLIFKSNAHLKRLSNNQRVFVWLPVPEPVLFFYLVTTVLQPLSIHQGDTIVKLWKDEFGGSPVGLATVKDQYGAGWKKWEEASALWKAAIDWLCNLAYQVTNLGKPYLIKKLTNWDGKVSNICANAQWKNSLHSCGDADSALVFGLTRDELVSLLSLTPILLSNILSREEIDGLEGELDLA